MSGILLPVMSLARLQRFGHTPIALVGGGTGLIGDPSGKSLERPLLTFEQVEANAHGIRTATRALSRLHAGDQRRADGEQPRVAASDWLSRFPPRRRQTLHRELHDGEGVGEAPTRRARRASPSPNSATSCCRRTTIWCCTIAEGCSLQMGGSDQWGNITAGCDLIRKVRGDASARPGVAA